MVELFDLYKFLFPSSFDILLLEYEIVKNPMGLVQFTMNVGEKIVAEAAAMVFIRGNIETETRMRKGGFLKSLKAAAFGGESFFVNEFTAHEDNCKLGLTGNMLEILK